MNGVFCTLILSTLIYCIYLILKKAHFRSKKCINKIAKCFRFIYNGDSDKNEFVCKCCFAKKLLRQGD